MHHALVMLAARHFQRRSRGRFGQSAHRGAVDLLALGVVHAAPHALRVAGSVQISGVSRAARSAQRGLNRRRRPLPVRQTALVVAVAVVRHFPRARRRARAMARAELAFRARAGDRESR